MREEYLTFRSKTDGLTIHAVLAAPESGVKGTVLMAHDIMEYKERYLPLMRFLARNGYACMMNDHRGYGKSVKAPEDNGYTYGGGAKATIQDFETLGEMLKERFPGIGMHLYGHSMGALIAVNYLKTHSAEVKSAILSGLPENNPAAGAGKQYLKLRRMLKGDRFRDENVNKLMFKSYASAFKGETSPHAWINSSKERVKEYEADPLCGNLGTVDGYLSLIDLLIGAYDKKGFVRVFGSLPVHILVGADDPCAGNRAGAEKSAEALRKAGFTKTEVKAYPGRRHEIHNEDNWAEVYADILERL